MRILQSQGLVNLTARSLTGCVVLSESFNVFQYLNFSVPSTGYLPCFPDLSMALGLRRKDSAFSSQIAID